MKPDSNMPSSAVAPALSSAVAPAFPERADRAPLAILSADGDAIVQRILRAVFERRGWFVCQVSDGREALDALQAERFDLVVLDLNLAYLNGFELLDALGKRPAAARPRAVVASAQTQPEPVLRAFQLGADDFVDKPLVPEILLARIERLFKRPGM